MKKITLITKTLVLIILAMLWLLSCNKEGPQGIIGPAGSAGTAGAVGPAGKSGMTLLKGTGNPANINGNLGDYYLDTNSGSLYGPKTSSGWGTPFTFSGSAAGKMYGGSGMPGNTLGIAGDFYLDTTGYALYGPKQSDQHWGPGIYLNGTSGSTGVTEYIINNPNDYFTNGIGDTRYNFYLKILNDNNNNFNLWNDMNVKHALVKVYLKQKITTYDNDGDSTGFYYNISPATGALVSNFSNYSEDGSPSIEGSCTTAQEGLYVYFSNYNCDCSDDNFLTELKTNLHLTSVMIYVISPSSFNNITPSVPPLDSTTFTDNADGWTLSGNIPGANGAPFYSTTGGVNGGYIYAKDNAATGVWYFKAPSSYLGYRINYYGASLSFSLFQHSEMKTQFDSADIILESGAEKIVYQLPKHPDSTWTNYKVVISTDADWKYVGYNGTSDAQEYQIENILNNLTGIYIRGKYEAGTDEGGMDNIQITGN
ncbi:MAG: laminin B domain-containing protein [Ginsengibacter sp.]